MDKTLKEQRQACQLTQLEAGQLMRTGKSTWQGWEYGRRNMPVLKREAWLKIVAALACTPNL